MSKRRSTHDVIVVGARCAGAATAMLLARQGHDVVVVDRSRPRSDTLSTHGIYWMASVLTGRPGPPEAAYMLDNSPLATLLAAKRKFFMHRRIRSRLTYRAFVFHNVLPDL